MGAWLVLVPSAVWAPVSEGSARGDHPGASEARAQAGAPTGADASAGHRAAKVEWLRSHAVAVRSIEPEDEDFSDLMPLVEHIGTARVVQLGEATHGDGATFRAKARLLRFLHQVMGFDVLAWEAGFFDCRYVNAALRGDGPLAEAGSEGLYAIWWQSAQAQAVLAYVRSTQATPRPILTVGFDSRVSTESNRNERFPRFIFDFFDRLDPGLLSPAERADLTTMSAGLVPKEYYENPGPRTYNRALPRRLVATLDERRGEILTFAGADDIAYVRQSLVSLMSMDRALERGDDGFNRDTAMAENLLWQLRGPLAGRKVVVWAHNYHILEGFPVAAAEEAARRAGRPLAGPMGRFVADELGGDLYSVAFTAHHGRYGWAGEEPEPLPEAAPDSLEALLHDTGLPHLFLPLQGLPGDHWLRRPLGGNFYLYEPHVTDWPRVYDAVFFLDAMTPSTRIPDAELP